MIQRLSKKQSEILLAAAKYKFITHRQIVRLGIEKHKNKCSTLCGELRAGKRPLLKKIPHRVGHEVKHYLTKRGKDMLLDWHEHLEENNILYPKGAILTDTQDQKHRTTTIDIQIELDLTTEQTEGVHLLWADRYFDTVGNNRISKNLKSKTAVLYDDKHSVKADLIFMLQTNTQKELYLVELENGKDTKKAVQKCINHAKAIFRKSANEKYNFQQAYRTLWIFEHESIMQATMDRLQDNDFFKYLTEFFLFKPLAHLQNDFLMIGWISKGKGERCFILVRFAFREKKITILVALFLCVNESSITKEHQKFLQKTS